MKGFNLVQFELPQGRYHKKDRVTVCKLYNTLVARIIQGDDPGTLSIYLNHGGFITMSTAKAMNKALAAASIQGNVVRKLGQMFFQFNGKQLIGPSGFLGSY